MANFGYLNVKDFGAKGDGVTDDTAKIQAAFNAAAAPGMEGTTVFIPAGVYMVGNYLNTSAALQFAANGCKLTGGGTLKHIADPGVKSGIILRIVGNRNSINWIRIDGNVSGGALSTTNGYTVVGMHNHSRGVFVTNIGSSSIVHFGKANRLDRSTAVGGHDGLRDGGAAEGFNIMRYCMALEYAKRGWINDSDFIVWTTTIGCHVETKQAAEGGAAYFSDPTAVNSTFNRAIFRDCTAIAEHSDPGTTNGTKFAVVKDVYFDGCQIFHATTTVTTFRVAERVDRVRLKDTFLSRDFFFESNISPFPKEVRLERVWIGDGVQDPDYAIGRGRCDVLIVSDCVMQGYKSGGIEWRGPDGTYTLIAAANCDFNGDLPSNIPPAPPATSDILAQSGGQLNRSGKLSWLGNRRTNIGAGGLSRFTNPAVTNELLGTTQDASISVYAGAAVPTGGLANWSVGDTVVNNPPSSGGYYGWVCTTAGAPGTWKQWGLIS